LKKARVKLREEISNAIDKEGLSALQVKLGEIDGQLKELAAV
jgi:hypothetical protein